MSEPQTIEAYLAAQPADRRAVLEAIRAAVRIAAPDATETIAYDMPAYRDARGDFLVSFAAYQRHYSLFPASGAVIEALGSEVAPYLVGKATIRFAAGRPVPYGLVTRIVAVRVAELAARGRS